MQECTLVEFFHLASYEKLLLYDYFMFSLEGSSEPSNTVDQVMIVETDFENSRRYNVIDVTCCNVVHKGRL